MACVTFRALAVSSFCSISSGPMIVVSGANIKPKAERVNPAKGFKRTFSAQGAWQAGKVLLKSASAVGA